MSTSILHLEVPSKAPKKKRGRPALAPEVIEARKAVEATKRAKAEIATTTNPVDQALVAFHHGSRAAAIVGFGLGGFVPLASFTLIHLEVAQRPQLWTLVAGGLVYSALSIYGWATHAFGHRLKALGFVVLLEGTLTFCHVAWLALAGLSILMLLNGITAAVTLQGSGERSDNA